jgi:hypothetical protein
MRTPCVPRLPGKFAHLSTLRNEWRWNAPASPVRAAPELKHQRALPSDSALIVLVVYHSCRKKSSEKCRGVMASFLVVRQGYDLAPARDGLALRPAQRRVQLATWRQEAAATSNRRPSQTPGSDSLCYSCTYGPSTKWSTC